MSGNTFGTLFTVTNFGESHGPAIGCVIDGCPPGMSLCEADIQHDLDRRRPGTSRHVTQRNKPAEQIKAAPAQKRSSFTRSPVWSLNQPQPYGASTRVAACTALSNPMMVMEKPNSLSHNGRYGLKNPICAK